MEITIKSYIKEKVKIELWQCRQNILSIDLSEGEDCVTDIDLPEYGKTEILVSVSYEEPEEAGNFLDHFLWGLYYLLDGDIGSPLDGESGLIGTKISGEFREDTALKLSCVGSSPSKGYVVTIECKENLEKLYYLRVGKEELEKKVKEWKKRVFSAWLIVAFVFICGMLYGILRVIPVMSIFCGVVILLFLVLLCVRFRDADKQVEHLYEKATDEI